jgi:hypothetical protein
VPCPPAAEAVAVVMARLAGGLLAVVRCTMLNCICSRRLLLTTWLDPTFLPLQASPAAL